MSTRNRSIRFATQLLLLSALIALAPGQSAWAIGTPAGTDITNQASATWDVGAQTFTTNSNTTTTRVAELLDVAVVWQDAAIVAVNPGDLDQVVTFRLTNTGNGLDQYTLTALSTLAGDNFDPTLKGVFLDTNGNNSYDVGTDLPYVQGLNDPLLNADAFLTVFVTNDIPGGLVNGDTGDSQLSATSSTGFGPPGTVLLGAGELGTDAVVGTSGGVGSDIGTYGVGAVAITVAKSVVVVGDPFGGTEPLPGAVLTYSLDVDVTGAGTALGVVITDLIPTNTTYVANTLTLNAAPLSDGADADAGDVGATTAGTVTVDLGNLADVAPVQTITFDVTID